MEHLKALNVAAECASRVQRKCRTRRRKCGPNASDVCGGSASVPGVPNAPEEVRWRSVPVECSGCTERAHGVCWPNAADVPNAPMEKICKSPFTVVKYTIYM